MGTGFVFFLPSQINFNLSVEHTTCCLPGIVEETKIRRMNKLRLCLQRVIAYSDHLMHWGLQLQPARVKCEITTLNVALKSRHRSLWEEKVCIAIINKQHGEDDDNDDDDI